MTLKLMVSIPWGLKKIAEKLSKIISNKTKELEHFKIHFEQLKTFFFAYSISEYIYIYIIPTNSCVWQHHMQKRKCEIIAENKYVYTHGFAMF